MVSFRDDLEKTGRENFRVFPFAFFFWLILLLTRGGLDWRQAGLAMNDLLIVAVETIEIV